MLVLLFSINKNRTDKICVVTEKKREIEGGHACVP
jgi:hypothetical protein